MLSSSVRLRALPPLLAVLLAALPAAADEFRRIPFDEIKVNDVLKDGDALCLVRVVNSGEIRVFFSGTERTISRAEYDSSDMTIKRKDRVLDPDAPPPVEPPPEGLPAYGPIAADELRVGMYVEVNDDWGIVKSVRRDGTLVYRPKGGFADATVGPPFDRLVHIPEREWIPDPIDPSPGEPVPETPVARDALDMENNRTIVTIPVEAPREGSIHARRLVKVALFRKADLLSTDDEMQWLANDPDGPSGYTLHTGRDGHAVYARPSGVTMTKSVWVDPLVATDTAYSFEIVFDEQWVELRSVTWDTSVREMPIEAPTAVPALIQLYDRLDFPPLAYLDVLARNPSPKLLGHIALHLCEEDPAVRRKAREVLLAREVDDLVPFFAEALDDVPVSVTRYINDRETERTPVPNSSLFTIETIACLRNIRSQGLNEEIFNLRGEPDPEVQEAVRTYFADLDAHLSFLVNQWTAGEANKPWVEELLQRDPEKSCEYIGRTLAELGAEPEEIEDARSSERPVVTCLTLLADWLIRVFGDERFVGAPGWKTHLLDAYNLERATARQKAVRETLARKAASLSNQVRNKDRLTEVRLLERAFMLDPRDVWVQERLGRINLDVAEEMLEDVSIRKEPSPYSQVLQVVQPGQQLSPGPQPFGEFFAVIADGGFTGWIHHSLLAPDLEVEASSRPPKDVERHIAIAITYDSKLLEDAKSLLARNNVAWAAQAERDGNFEVAYQKSIAAWNHGEAGFPLSGFLFANWGVLLGGLGLAAGAGVGLTVMQRRGAAAAAVAEASGKEPAMT